MWLAVFLLLAPALGKRLAGGYAHFCVVQPNAQTFCFGWNRFGNLGNGSPNETSAFPTQVLDVEDTVDVCAGGAHSCFLGQDGYVQCAGFNLEGMLGDGTTEHRSRVGDAVNVTGLVSHVECSFFQTCAVLRNNSGVECWGGNSFGELGDNSTVSRHVPVPMLGLDSTVVHAVGTGVFHTCVVVGSGHVWCTGGNSAGQLGGAAVQSSAVLVPVWGLDEQAAVSVHCGYEHSCAVMSTGKVYCWGGNAAGQLGVGSAVASSPHPLAVGGSSGSSVSCGYFNSFVVDHGAATAFGDNAFHQFATTDNTAYFAPERAFANLSVAEIRSGYRTTCVATTDGSVHCVGADVYGQLGIGGSSSNASSSLVRAALPETSALTAGQIQCQPRAAMGRLRCTVLTKLCKSLHRIQLKWVGSGCKNRKVKDAGCQCLGYCGFTCKQECNKNGKYCRWTQGGGCSAKASAAQTPFQRKAYCDVGL